jgi:hypothetical protein
MVQPFEVHFENVDATGLLSQGHNEGVHLATPRNGVRQVPRLALRGIKVSASGLTYNYTQFLAASAGWSAALGGEMDAGASSWRGVAVTP